MELNVDITVSDDIEVSDDDVPEPALLQVWASAAFPQQSSTSPNTSESGAVTSQDENDAVVSILISSEQEIRLLNKQYREKDKATNVLSFPMLLPDELLAEDIGMQLLGDIALCAVVINEEARQQSKSSHAHWAHMVVHGMLHLQGYDHIDCDEAETMEALEIEILKSLGFDSPYELTEQVTIRQ